MTGEADSTWIIQLTVNPGESVEVTSLRGAAQALDHLTAEQALAACEYLATRYRGMVR